MPVQGWSINPWNEHQSSQRSTSKQHYVRAFVIWMESQDITHYWVRINNRVSQPFGVWYLAIPIHSPYPKWRAWSQAKQRGRAKADKVFYNVQTRQSIAYWSFTSCADIKLYLPTTETLSLGRLTISAVLSNQVVSLLPQLSHETMLKKNVAFVNPKLSFLSSKIANKS